MAANGNTSAPAGESIDSANFSGRLQSLYGSWEASRASLWGGAEALVVASGPGSDDLRYLKSSALQLWLLGYEFPDTIMVFLPGDLHFICSKKKGSMLEAAKASFPDGLRLQVAIHVKGRNEDGSAQIAAVLAALKESLGSSPTVGWLPKEKPEGDLMSRWQSALSSSGATLVDAAPGLANLLAIKDEGEIVNVKRAALLAASVLKVHAIAQVEEIIDQEKTVTHTKLSEDTEMVLLEPSKVNVKLRAENVDLAYPPIFQSGGEYDIRPAAESSSGTLDFGTCGVIVLAVGAKYNSYCASIARSLLIDSTKHQEKVYKALLRAQEAIIAALRPGARLADVYQSGLAVVQADAPDAVPYVAKTFGSSMGLELREGTFSISPKSKETVRAHMCFHVAVGVQQVPNPQAPAGARKEYALLLADTVIVKQDQPEVATASCSRAWTEVAYSFKDGDEEEPDVKPAPLPPRRAAAMADSKGSLRSEKELNKEEERKKAQAELVTQKNEETRQRILAMANGASGAHAGAGPAGGGRGSGGDATAYRSVDDIPISRELMIQVDQRSEAVLLPIYGLMVPFHVGTIKNVSSSQDGGISLIRINFNVPGAAFGSGYGPAVKYPDSIFLREVSYRSSDARHSNSVVQLLKTMRRQVAQRESEQADRATLAPQQRLQILKGRAPRLTDVWIRPAFGGRGKKATGSLEAHANGFRYATNKADERLDIMYGNIKHAVFQPAVNEMITLIHFHLHHPIMLGKKKTQDVQFYAEVMDVVQTVQGGRRAMYDPDEIEEEQRERERRNKINKDFEAFVKRAQDLFGDLDLEFDVPFNQFAFTGVPFKTSAKIIPCVNCLVSLIEVPFLCVTLDEIEIVSLERVGMSKKSFDMAIVFKDFRKDVHRIDAIPTTSLEMIKEWLNSMKIKYYENRLNLSWRPILKTILDDPDKFVEDGGWEFLNADASDEEGGSDEESDAYEPSDEEAASESSEEEDDESVVASDEDDDDDSSGDEEEEEEGMDWDELEEQAARDDRDRSDEDDSEEDRRNKKSKARPPDHRGGRPHKKSRR